MLMKEKLKHALALLEGVEVKGLDNMKRFVLGTEDIKACISAIETVEKEEAERANDHNEKREDA